MPSVTMDRINMLEATERHGVVTRLVRQALVSGLTGTDYLSLAAALSEAGVPEAGAILTGYTDLVLTERNPRMIDLDKCEVDLTYEHFLNDGQNLDTPVFGKMMGEITTSVQQKSSNLDENGEQIFVTHTFPATDDDYPNETIVQGGEIEIYEPQKTLNISGKLVTPRPWLVAKSIIRHVNEDVWYGEPARTWMCTAANWRPLDMTEDNNSFFVTYEFQHNSDTWDPTVVFIDERTGKPPPDLVTVVEEGADDLRGIKTIQWHPSVDFELAIRSLVMGA